MLFMFDAPDTATKTSKTKQTWTAETAYVPIAVN